MSKDKIENYSCPMHPEVKSIKSGKCPKCGMDLVVNSSLQNYRQRDHREMMSGQAVAEDFLRRFMAVTVLLIPLALFSGPAVRMLGIPDFTLRPYLEFSIATAIFYYGLIFFRHARMEIAMRQFGMMTLVSLGVGAGYIFSAASTFIPAIHTEFYLEISTLIWILLFGHFLEARSSGAAGDALAEVSKLLPQEAHLITRQKSKVKTQNLENDMQDVNVENLRTGDIVLVRPGEKVPADGIIISGKANFNEAHLTGESLPLEKSVNDAVVAGAINLDGSVEVRLTRVGESSTVGQIRQLVASAQKTKPSVQKLADRAAKWLTFSALSVALITLIFWSAVASQSLVFAITLAITVLVIACPHALGLAIPTVTTIATRLAVQNGLFIKDLSKIEVVKDTDYVVFDKTGTLTKGEFGVTDIKVISGSEADLLSIAGAVEAHSSHYIGQAILRFLKAKKIPPAGATNIKNIAGKGIQGTYRNTSYLLGNQRLMEEQKLWSKSLETIAGRIAVGGKTPVFVADQSKIIGVLALSDQIKEESRLAVGQLHHLGVKVAMLTGDTEAAATEVAGKLGIDTVFAEVLPEDKYIYIRRLQNEGKVVLMAGDGINDAPALTQADAGVAIGAGTDVAVEAGDIILTQNNPEHLVRLIVLSRKVYRKMQENLLWAAGYNIFAIPAAAGLFIPWGFRLTPAMGALFMSLSSVIVVANAFSLTRVKLQTGN